MALRLVVLGLFACAAAVVVAIVLASRADHSQASKAPAAQNSAPPPKPKALEIPLERLVGQRVIGSFVGTTAPASVLRRIERGELGGIILFGQNIASDAQVATLVQRLQAAAKKGGNPPLLISTDQEGGIVKRLPSAPPAKSAAEMGSAYSTTQVRRAGTATGVALRRLGINVDLAPVLDVPSFSASFLGSRAFSQDPRVVTAVGPAFASGLQAARVAATAKHFPGLGTATGNTDLSTIVITSPRAELTRRLAPFHAAVRSGIKIVMVSNATYRALDPKGLPAALSPRIVTGLLRKQLGFRGIVITDTMSAPGIVRFRHSPLLALRAGVDLLLYSSNEQVGADAYRELIAAARAGRLKRADLETTYARIIALKAWLQR
jgi:beta-N-acetylhexosaminidase